MILGIIEILRKVATGWAAYSLVYVDIDFYIRYSMKFGEVCCQTALRKIDEFFNTHFGANRVFRKEGDDEYLILVAETGADAETRMRRTLAMFRKEPFMKHCGKDYANLRITFSAGVASYPSDGEFDIVLKKAATALFLAQSYRRNQIVRYAGERKAQPQRILFASGVAVETVAGQWGMPGKIDQAQPAKEGHFWEPQGIACNSRGQLFIADQDNHQIVQMTGDTVRRIVGTGCFGYSGDGGPATEARLNKPTALWATDHALYIADTGNDVVRLVDLQSGLISTVCGTGKAGYAGDGGPAWQARLNNPGGVVVDRRGNLYIADIANNVVRRMDRQGMLSTFAGDSTFGYQGDGHSAVQARFNEIYGIGIDWKGEVLFVADYYNHCIRQIDLQSQRIETIAGKGIAGYEGDGAAPDCALLNRPVAVCGGPYGTVYIAESGSHSVRILSLRHNKIFTLVGGLGPGIGRDGHVDGLPLANPNGLAMDKEDLYVLDGANQRILRVALSEMLGKGDKIWKSIK